MYFMQFTDNQDSERKLIRVKYCLIIRKLSTTKDLLTHQNASFDIMILSSNI